MALSTEAISGEVLGTTRCVHSQVSSGRIRDQEGTASSENGAPGTSTLVACLACGGNRLSRYVSASLKLLGCLGSANDAKEQECAGRTPPLGDKA